MTHSDMAVLNGSRVEGVDSPRVLTRTRARPSVTKRDAAVDHRTRREALRDVKIARIWARVWAAGRQLGALVWSDTLDAWYLADRSPSLKTVWATRYDHVIPGDYRPFAVWCQVWRYPAVLAAAGLDAVKLLLIHPVRGPLFLTVTAAGVAAAYLS